MQRHSTGSLFVNEHHVYVLRLHTAGGSLCHVADSSSECFFFAETLYSRKKMCQSVSVSAQIEEDLDGVELQSRYEISVKNYKSALCFFAALYCNQWVN